MYTHSFFNTVCVQVYAVMHVLVSVAIFVLVSGVMYVPVSAVMYVPVRVVNYFTSVLQCRCWLVLEYMF
jgi:hypothetical protein